MISVLVVARDCSLSVAGALDAVQAVLVANFRHYEIIFVDNGSIDGTDRVVLSLLGNHRNLRYLRLTRPHPADAALCCAMEAAVGDVAVTFDLLLDAPASIPVLATRASDGVIAIARRRRHEGKLRASVARAFYWLAKRTLGSDLRMDEGNQRAYPRQILNALGRIKNRRRNLRFFSASIGFRREIIDVPVSSETRHESIFAIARRNIDLLLSNSIAPLRVAAALGLLGASLNGLYLLYVVLVALLKNHTAEGWITQSLSTTGMFFLVFLILAIMVEYLGRILEEVQERPLYFVEMERDSPASVGTKTLNVV